MGKISNILLMIKVLQNGKIYKIKDLAKIIEVTPRQIRSYKSELEKAGIYIESIPGPYGGYTYNATNEISDISFDISELNNLEQILMYLYEQDDGEKYINKLTVIVEKLRYLLLYSKNETSFMNCKMKNKFYNVISKAIINNSIIEIEYLKGKTVLKVVKMIPQNIFKNNMEFYLTGVCTETKDIRTFPFSKIRNIKIL